jgi:hypothetical protein
VSERADEFTGVAVVLQLVDALDDSGPVGVVRGCVVRDLVEEEVGTPARYVHCDVVPDFPFEEATLGGGREEVVCRREESGEEDAAVYAVYVEEVEFDLVRGLLGCTGEVDCGWS